MQFLNLKSISCIIILLQPLFVYSTPDNERTQFNPVNYFGECEFYFRKPQNWGRDLTVYAYNDDQNTELSSWPGEQMRVYDHNEDEDVYYGKIYCEYFNDNTRIIFSDGSNQVPGKLEEGFIIKEHGLFTEEGLESICHYKEVSPGKYIKTLVCEKL